MELGIIVAWVMIVVTALVAAAGGLLATCAGVRHIADPLRREVAAKAAVAIWGLAILYVVVLWVLPREYTFLLAIPYIAFAGLVGYECGRVPYTLPREPSDPRV